LESPNQNILYIVWNDPMNPISTTLYIRVFTADGSLDRVQSFNLEKQNYDPSSLESTCSSAPETLPSEYPRAIETDFDNINIVQTAGETYLSFNYRLSSDFQQYANQLKLTLLGSSEFTTFMPTIDKGDNPKTCDKWYSAGDITSWKPIMLKWNDDASVSPTSTLKFLIMYGPNFYLKNSATISLSRRIFGEISSEVSTQTEFDESQNIPTDQFIPQTSDTSIPPQTFDQTILNSEPIVNAEQPPVQEQVIQPSVPQDNSEPIVNAEQPPVQFIQEQVIQPSVPQHTSLSNPIVPQIAAYGTRYFY